MLSKIKFPELSRVCCLGVYYAAQNLGDMEYSQSSWQHTDFTPATCPKCGRMVFATGGDGDLSKQCFSCSTVVEENDKVGNDVKRVKQNHIEGYRAGDVSCQLELSDKQKLIDNVNTKTSKKKRKTKQKYVTTAEENEQDDDTSSQHSNSSLTSKKRTKRSSRRYCEIHSRRTRKSCKDGDTGEEYVEPVNNKDETIYNCNVSRKVCTCKKISRKRPEPEGGLANVPLMDEYDRIIYNNDPLFSDIDDNPELEAKVLQDIERHHSQFRLRTGAASVASVSEGIFSAAQMVNSNTSLKFAIIQVELKNVDVSLVKVNTNKTVCMRLLSFTNNGTRLAYIWERVYQPLVRYCE